MEETTLLLKTTLSLLLMVDPPAAIPLFLGLTQGESEGTRHQLARIAALATVVILLIAALIGKWLLMVFGISIPSFRVAGGILFLFMGLDMLNARASRSRETPEEIAEAGSRKEIAIVPLAIPQLAGPGAIGSVILFADSGPFWSQIARIAAVIVVVGLASWITLSLATSIGKALGKTGMNILNRIMGLLLIAVAVEFVVNGAKTLWLGH